MDAYWLYGLGREEYEKGLVHFDIDDKFNYKNGLINHKT